MAWASIEDFGVVEQLERQAYVRKEKISLALTRDDVTA